MNALDRFAWPDSADTRQQSRSGAGCLSLHTLAGRPCCQRCTHPKESTRVATPNNHNTHTPQ